MKYILILLIAHSICYLSCKSQEINNVKTINEFTDILGIPTCSAQNEFGGFSLIFTDECGCGNSNGFFGNYWNIYCDTDEQLKKIKHANYLGNPGKWKLVVDFFESRTEQEGRTLLEMTNSILKSSENEFDPYKYYENIRVANEFLLNVQSESFRKDFRDFLENDFDNFEY